MTGLSDIGVFGEGSAFGTLAIIVSIAFGFLSRQGARREAEGAKRVRELETRVGALQEQVAQLSRENGTLLERVDALRVALTRHTDSPRQQTG